MKFKLILATLIIVPIMLTACAKKEEAKDAESKIQATETVSTQTTPEQQAAIDAIDKPNLDEKNTDVVIDENDHSEHAASEGQ